MTIKGYKPVDTAGIPEDKSGWMYRLSSSLVLKEARPEYPLSGSAKLLVLKTGRAFPLGHPTTRLCLDLLTGTLAAKPGHSLVEIGCGTGVICLAAAALGVPKVIGLDIDRQAVRMTRHNARKNALAKAIQVVQGSSECLRGCYDLVVANLPWEIQMNKSGELHRLSTPTGRIILSGFRDNQEELLRNAYQELGWTLSQRLVKYFTHPEMPPTISFNWVAWLLEKK